jgi:hypothetical protein
MMQSLVVARRTPIMIRAPVTVYGLQSFTGVLQLISPVRDTMPYYTYVQVYTAEWRWALLTKRSLVTDLEACEVT